MTVTKIGTDALVRKDWMVLQSPAVVICDYVVYNSKCRLGRPRKHE